MSSLVQIVGYYGAAGTKTALTTQRYNTAIPSQRDPGLDYANNVPDEGETSRSCWMNTGVEILEGGSFSRCKNFRWGTPGNIKSAWKLGSSGGMVQVAFPASGLPGCPVAEYAAPTGVSGEYGFDIMDPEHGHPWFSGGSVADADAYDEDNPLLFDDTAYLPGDVPVVTWLIYHQLVLKDDTEFGEKAELEYFVKWQEI